jgi:hypothetical protein
MKTGYTFFTRNHSVFLAFLPAVLMLFTACEKVLDIDLKDAEPRIVIEGNVTDQPGPYQVKLTKSVSFSDPNVFPTVTGAQVTISDNAGNVETLTETEAGTYKTTNLQGVPGRNYFLKVVAEGQEYNAVSSMPAAIQIQQITIEKFEFNTDEVVPKIKFQDPAGVKNFYRAIYIVNGIASDNLFFLDDQFQDGSLIEGTLFDPDMRLKSGDVVTVILQCIDENNLNYLREEDLIGSSQSASPANPTSNISNNALGYFSAHTLSTATIPVP